MFGGRQHGDDDVGVLHGFRRRGRRGAAALSRVLNGLRYEIERANIVPRFGEVRRHPAAHVAQADECDACHQRPFQFPGRFSTNAAMPSFWSSVPNSPWNRRRSKRMPCDSGISKAALTISLTAIAARGGIVAIASAVLSASSSSWAAGTTFATRPE